MFGLKESPKKTYLDTFYEGHVALMDQIRNRYMPEQAWRNYTSGWYLAKIRSTPGGGSMTDHSYLIYLKSNSSGIGLKAEIYVDHHGVWNYADSYDDKLVKDYLYAFRRVYQKNPPLGDRGPLVKEVAGFMEKNMPVITGMQRAAVGTRRDAVSAGQVFRLVKQDGTLGDKTYGAISRNGKHYSINLVSGELASTRSGDKRVKVVGSFKINQQMLLNGQRRQTTRGQVKDNEMFVVKGGRNVYANLGTTAERKFISLNLGNENHAVTTKAAKRVVVIGTYTIQVDALRA